MNKGDRVSFKGPDGVERVGTVEGSMPNGMIDIRFDDANTRVERRASNLLTVVAKSNPSRTRSNPRPARAPRRTRREVVRSSRALVVKRNPEQLMLRGFRGFDKSKPDDTREFYLFIRVIENVDLNVPIDVEFSLTGSEKPVQKILVNLAKRLVLFPEVGPYGLVRGGNGKVLTAHYSTLEAATQAISEAVRFYEERTKGGVEELSEEEVSRISGAYSDAMMSSFYEADYEEGQDEKPEEVDDTEDIVVDYRDNRFVYTRKEVEDFREKLKGIKRGVQADISTAALRTDLRMRDVLPVTVDSLIEEPPHRLAYWLAYLNVAQIERPEAFRGEEWKEYALWMRSGGLRPGSSGTRHRGARFTVDVSGVSSASIPLEQAINLLLTPYLPLFTETAKRIASAPRAVGTPSDYQLVPAPQSGPEYDKKVADKIVTFTASKRAEIVREILHALRPSALQRVGIDLVAMGYVLTPAAPRRYVPDVGTYKGATGFTQNERIELVIEFDPEKAPVGEIVKFYSAGSDIATGVVVSTGDNLQPSGVALLTPVIAPQVVEERKIRNVLLVDCADMFSKKEFLSPQVPVLHYTQSITEMLISPRPNEKQSSSGFVRKNFVRGRPLEKYMEEIREDFIERGRRDGLINMTYLVITPEGKVTGPLAKMATLQPIEAGAVEPRALLETIIEFFGAASGDAIFIAFGKEPGLSSKLKNIARALSGDITRKSVWESDADFIEYGSAGTAEIPANAEVRTTGRQLLVPHEVMTRLQASTKPAPPPKAEESPLALTDQQADQIVRLFTRTSNRDREAWQSNLSEMTWMVENGIKTFNAPLSPEDAAEQIEEMCRDAAADYLNNDQQKWLASDKRLAIEDAFKRAKNEVQQKTADAVRLIQKTVLPDGEPENPLDVLYQPYFQSLTHLTLVTLLQTITDVSETILGQKQSLSKAVLLNKSQIERLAGLTTPAEEPLNPATTLYPLTNFKPSRAWMIIGLNPTAIEGVVKALEAGHPHQGPALYIAGETNAELAALLQNTVPSKETLIEKYRLRGSDAPFANAEALGLAFLGLDVLVRTIPSLQDPVCAWANAVHRNLQRHNKEARSKPTPEETQAGKQAAENLQNALGRHVAEMVQASTHYFELRKSLNQINDEKRSAEASADQLKTAARKEIYDETPLVQQCARWVDQVATRFRFYDGEVVLPVSVSGSIARIATADGEIKEVPSTALHSSSDLANAAKQIAEQRPEICSAWVVTHSLQGVSRFVRRQREEYLKYLLESISKPEDIYNQKKLEGGWRYRAKAPITTITRTGQRKESKKRELVAEFTQTWPVWTGRKRDEVFADLRKLLSEGGEKGRLNATELLLLEQKYDEAIAAAAGTKAPAPSQEFRRESSAAAQREQTQRVSFQIAADASIHAQIRPNRAAVFLKPDPPRMSKDLKVYCGNPIDGMAYYLVVDTSKRFEAPYVTWDEVEKAAMTRFEDGKRSTKRLPSPEIVSFTAPKSADQTIADIQANLRKVLVDEAEALSLQIADTATPEEILSSIHAYLASSNQRLLDKLPNLSPSKAESAKQLLEMNANVLLRVNEFNLKKQNEIAQQEALKASGAAGTYPTGQPFMTGDVTELIRYLIAPRVREVAFTPEEAKAYREAQEMSVETKRLLDQAKQEIQQQQKQLGEEDVAPSLPHSMRSGTYFQMLTQRGPGLLEDEARVLADIVRLESREAESVVPGNRRYLAPGTTVKNLLAEWEVRETECDLLSRGRPEGMSEADYNFQLRDCEELRRLVLPLRQQLNNLQTVLQTIREAIAQAKKTLGASQFAKKILTAGVVEGAERTQRQFAAAYAREAKLMNLVKIRIANPGEPVAVYTLRDPVESQISAKPGARVEIQIPKLATLERLDQGFSDLKSRLDQIPGFRVIPFKYRARSYMRIRPAKARLQSGKFASPKTRPEELAESGSDRPQFMLPDERTAYFNYVDGVKTFYRVSRWRSVGTGYLKRFKPYDFRSFRVAKSSRLDEAMREHLDMSLQVARLLIQSGAVSVRNPGEDESTSIITDPAFEVIGERKATRSTDPEEGAKVTVWLKDKSKSAFYSWQPSLVPLEMAEVQAARDTFGGIYTPCLSKEEKDLEFQVKILRGELIRVERAFGSVRYLINRVLENPQSYRQEREDPSPRKIRRLNQTTKKWEDLLLPRSWYASDARRVFSELAYAYFRIKRWQDRLEEKAAGDDPIASKMAELLEQAALPVSRGGANFQLSDISRFWTRFITEYGENDLYELIVEKQGLYDPTVSDALDAMTMPYPRFRKFIRAYADTLSADNVDMGDYGEIPEEDEPAEAEETEPGKVRRFRLRIPREFRPLMAEMRSQGKSDQEIQAEVDRLLAEERNRGKTNTSLRGSRLRRNSSPDDPTSREILDYINEFKTSRIEAWAVLSRLKALRSAQASEFSQRGLAAPAPGSKEYITVEKVRSELGYSKDLTAPVIQIKPIQEILDEAAKKGATVPTSEAMRMIAESGLSRPSVSPWEPEVGPRNRPMVKDAIRWLDGLNVTRHPGEDYLAFVWNLLDENEKNIVRELRDASVAPEEGSVNLLGTDGITGLSRLLRDEGEKDRTVPILSAEDRIGHAALKKRRESLGYSLDQVADHLMKRKTIQQIMREGGGKEMLLAHLQNIEAGKFRNVPEKMRVPLLDAYLQAMNLDIGYDRWRKQASSKDKADYLMFLAKAYAGGGLRMKVKEAGSERIFYGDPLKPRQGQPVPFALLSRERFSPPDTIVPYTDDEDELNAQLDAIFDRNYTVLSLLNEFLPAHLGPDRVGFEGDIHKRGEGTGPAEVTKQLILLVHAYFDLGGYGLLGPLDGLSPCYNYQPPVFDQRLDKMVEPCPNTHGIQRMIQYLASYQTDLLGGQAHMSKTQQFSVYYTYNPVLFEITKTFWPGLKDVTIKEETIVGASPSGRMVVREKEVERIDPQRAVTYSHIPGVAAILGESFLFQCPYCRAKGYVKQKRDKFECASCGSTLSTSEYESEKKLQEKAWDADKPNREARNVDSISRAIEDYRRHTEKFFSLLKHDPLPRMEDTTLLQMVDAVGRYGEMAAMVQKAVVSTKTTTGVSNKLEAMLAPACTLAATPESRAIVSTSLILRGPKRIPGKPKTNFFGPQFFLEMAEESGVDPEDINEEDVDEQGLFTKGIDPLGQPIGHMSAFALIWPLGQPLASAQQETIKFVENPYPPIANAKSQSLSIFKNLRPLLATLSPPIGASRYVVRPQQGVAYPVGLPPLEFTTLARGRLPRADSRPGFANRPDPLTGMKKPQPRPKPGQILSATERMPSTIEQTEIQLLDPRGVIERVEVAKRKPTLTEDQRRALDALAELDQEASSLVQLAESAQRSGVDDAGELVLSRLRSVYGVKPYRDMFSRNRMNENAKNTFVAAFITEEDKTPYLAAALAKMFERAYQETNNDVYRQEAVSVRTRFSEDALAPYDEMSWPQDFADIAGKSEDEDEAMYNPRARGLRTPRKPRRPRR